MKTVLKALRAGGYEPFEYKGTMVSRSCLGVMVHDSKALVWLGYDLAQAGVDRTTLASVACDAIGSGIAVFWHNQRFEREVFDVSSN